MVTNDRLNHTNFSVISLYNQVLSTGFIGFMQKKQKLITLGFFFNKTDRYLGIFTNFTNIQSIFVKTNLTKNLRPTVGPMQKHTPVDYTYIHYN